MSRDVYSGNLKLHGEEHEQTLVAANNYADALSSLEHYAEAKALLGKVTPVARRVLGEGHRLALKMWLVYAQAIYNDDSATLGDLREAVTTLEDTARTARRVLGSAHPSTAGIELALRYARATLRAREASA